MLGTRLKNPNLLSQVSAPIAVRKAPGYYKSIILDVLTVLAAVGTGYLYREYLMGPLAPGWLLFGVAALLHLLMFGMLMAENQSRRIVVLAGTAAGLVVWFPTLPLQILGVATSIMFLFLLWGDIAGRRELLSGMEIRFFHIVRPQLRKVMTALILGGILLYLPQWTPEANFISKNLFTQMFQWAGGLTAQWYPNLRMDTDVQAFIDSIALEQVNKDPTYQQLPQAAKEQVYKQVTTELANTVSRMLAVKLDLQESVNNLAYRSLLVFLDQWQQKLGPEFITAWAIVAYLVFRTISVVYYLAVSFVAFIVYQILIASNFFSIIGETRLRERLQYP